MESKNNSKNKSKTSTKKDKRFLAGLGMVAAGVLIIGGGIFMLLNNKDEETITPSSFAVVGEEDSATACQNLMSSYYTAIMGEDSAALYKMMAPPEYWEYYMQTYGKTEEEIKDTYSDAINNTRASWQASCGSDAKVSFKIESSSEQTDEFLTEWSKSMNEAIGSDSLVAEEALTLNVDQTITGSSGTVRSTTTPTLIKVNGSWYILDEGIDQ